MSVRDLTSARPIPRFIKWLPIVAAAVILIPIFLSRPQAVRFQDLRVRADDVQWFSARAPNGSYGFVAITAPTEEPTKKPPKDSDGDGVPDNKDSCPSVPGSDADGCPPDADHDGIQDSADACPQVPGPDVFNGCPPPTPTPVLPGLPTSGACVLASRTSLTVNIRQEPSRSGSIVGSLPYNQTPNVIGHTINDAGEEWFQIDGGWVAGSVTRRGGDCATLPDPFAVPTIGAQQPPPPVETAEQGDFSQQPPTAAPLVTGDITVDKTNGVVPGSRGAIQFRDPTTGQIQIYLLQNGDATPLPPLGATVSYPALQPAGENLAFFTGDPSALADLRLVNLTQGGQPALLISARPDLKIAPFPAAWAPDGSALLVSLIDPVTNTPSVYRLNIQNGALNGQPQLLVANAFAPTYSQEGDRIAYVKGGLFNRSIEMMSLVDNSVTPITGTAPFDNCSMPAFGLGPGDLFFVCQTSGQTLLARFNQGAITPVAAPVTSVISLISTGSRYIVISDNATVYAAPLNALVFTPVLRSGGRPIEYLQWLQGEGIPAG